MNPDYTHPNKIFEVLINYGVYVTEFLKSDNFANLISFIGLIIIVLNVIIPNKVDILNKFLQKRYLQNLSRSELLNKFLISFCIFIILIFITSFCVYLFFFNLEQINDNTRSWFDKLFDYTFGIIVTISASIIMGIKMFQRGKESIIYIMGFLGNNKAISGLGIVIGLIGQIIKWSR